MADGFASGMPEQLASDPQVRKVYLGEVFRWCEKSSVVGLQSKSTRLTTDNSKLKNGC